MKKASVELRVAFADLDGMRAVYHTNYIKWFDLARTKLFRDAGFQMKSGRKAVFFCLWWYATANTKKALYSTIL